jgi:outer membrane lipoprotein-sorting protein
MVKRVRTSSAFKFVGAIASLFLGAGLLPAQPLDTQTVIQQVDAAVKARLDHVESYTVTEHYAVFRGDDETHAQAEMTVKTLYQRGTGKTYTILSESGSGAIRKFVLEPILDNEKHLNEPGVREGSWLTSANYEMRLKPEANQKLGAHDSIALAITPRRKAPYLLDGTIWVDSQTYQIVQIQGTGSKAASILTQPTQMMRQYESVEGYAMGTHARAVTNSALLGPTIVKIDYLDYHMQLSPAK